MYYQVTVSIDVIRKSHVTGVMRMHGETQLCHEGTCYWMDNKTFASLLFLYAG